MLGSVTQENTRGLDRMLRRMLASRQQSVPFLLISPQARSSAFHEAAGPRAKTRLVAFVALGGPLDDVPDTKHGLVRDADFKGQIPERRQRFNSFLHLVAAEAQC